MVALGNVEELLNLPDKNFCACKMKAVQKKTHISDSALHWPVDHSKVQAFLHNGMRYSFLLPPTFHVCVCKGSILVPCYVTYTKLCARYAAGSDQEWLWKVMKLQGKKRFSLKQVENGHLPYLCIGSLDSQFRLLRTLHENSHDKHSSWMRFTDIRPRAPDETFEDRILKEMSLQNRPSSC